MTIPYPFPYQGSKRRLATAIISLIPYDTETLIEPFAGAAAISISALYHQRVRRVLLNDINGPLMALWDLIINAPENLASKYREIWNQQHGQEAEYYFRVRDKFNIDHQPELLLFLLVRCVKASVRYNSLGEFNQAPDNRRKGTHPDNMRRQILNTSRLLCGKASLSSVDYREILQSVSSTDVVYLDPPYQGVCKKRDPRYLESLQFDAFVDTLRMLNRSGIRYIVSYDGRTGAKTHGQLLPSELGLQHLEIDAGRSSQATLLGQSSTTYESLYISPALQADLAGKRYNGLVELNIAQQLQLL